MRQTSGRATPTFLIILIKVGRRHICNIGHIFQQPPRYKEVGKKNLNMFNSASTIVAPVAVAADIRTQLLWPPARSEDPWFSLNLPD